MTRMVASNRLRPQTHRQGDQARCLVGAGVVIAEHEQGAAAIAEVRAQRHALEVVDQRVGLHGSGRNRGAARGAVGQVKEEALGHRLERRVVQGRSLRNVVGVDRRGPVDAHRVALAHNEATLEDEQVCIRERYELADAELGGVAARRGEVEVLLGRHEVTQVILAVALDADAAAIVRASGRRRR